MKKDLRTEASCVSAAAVKDVLNHDLFLSLFIISLALLKNLVQDPKAFFFLQLLNHKVVNQNQISCLNKIKLVRLYIYIYIYIYISEQKKREELHKYE